MDGLEFDYQYHTIWKVPVNADYVTLWGGYSTISTMHDGLVKMQASGCTFPLDIHSRIPGSETHERAFVTLNTMYIVL